MKSRVMGDRDKYKDAPMATSFRRGNEGLGCLWRIRDDLATVMFDALVTIIN